MYLAYILGGWYLPIAENIPMSDTTNTVDMTVSGIVESSIWARLIFEATDDYGNRTQQYNSDSNVFPAVCYVFDEYSVIYWYVWHQWLKRRAITFD